MTQGVDKIWHAEARIQETKQLIRDIKRITHHKFIAEEKKHIVSEGFRRDPGLKNGKTLSGFLNLGPIILGTL